MHRFLNVSLRKVAMHACARLFTSDLIANDCRVFDWLCALNTNDEKHLFLLVMLTLYGVNYEGIIALGLKRVKMTVHSSSHMVSIMKVACLCGERRHQESAWRVHYVNDIVMECQL